jgi:hypothetical protein
MSPVIRTGHIKLPVPENRIEGSSTITNAVSGFCFAENPQWAGVYGSGSSGSTGVIGISDQADGLHGESSGSNMSGVAGIHDGSGNGVYGTSRTGYAGNFQGNMLCSGNLTVQGDVILPNGDCAEQFDIVGPDPLEPGTLVVLDSTGALKPSDVSYDRKVAGVVARAGSYRPGIILDFVETDSVRATISILGKVYCKVDASYSPIEAGDLLTSSPTCGHAMKAVDFSKAFGSIVGKAMRAHPSGRGLIPILMALQ